MSIEINVPDIGINEMEVTEILVSVGDKIEVEQVLITVEGDKVSIEIPSPQAGVIKDIKIAVGDKVSTGKVIMIFEEITCAKSTVIVQQEEYNYDPKYSIVEKTESKEVKEITNNLVTLDKGDDQSLIDIDSNKNSFTVCNTDKNKDKFIKNNIYVHATPIIRRLAREFGVDLAKLKGTGRKNRILREDIYAYIKRAIKIAEVVPNTIASVNLSPELLSWPEIDFRKFGDTKEIELSRIQKKSGANLQRNWIMIPHITQFDEADITEVEAFRKQQNVELKNKNLDIKITILIFIMKAVAKALEELPRFNSSLSENSQKLTLKKYINIGVAVDTVNGLVVPVFRDVNKKNIIELSRDLSEISKKARAGKLTSLDMQGGCFTISSLGGIGGTAFTPIVNAPEVVVLGISKSSIKPVWDGKDFIPRLMLPLSLSYDHRVIDGVAGAKFINFINKLMSDIRHLIM